MAALLALALLFGPPARADELQIAVDGVEEPLLGNLRSRVQALHLGGGLRLTPRRREQLAERAEREATLSLRPYGYYQAVVESRWIETAKDSWRLELNVAMGPPVRVETAEIEVVGPGAGMPELQQWRNEWPLTAGRPLDQTAWEAEKQKALELAETGGYLSAAYSEHRIGLDLEANTAALRLVLDTGPRAVMGEVRFEQDAVRPGVLELLPRFSEGQPYDAWLLEKFRLDLWRTGYFDNVQVIEERRLEEEPPKVNLVVRAEGRTPNTYQGSLGWGTDTEVRAQVMWSRYLLSDRGDYFDLGLGWQQRFNEYSFRSTYRLPRPTRAREFWTSDFLVNRRRQDVQVRANDATEDYLQIATGDVTDYSFKAGRLLVRDFEAGYQQIFETWYGQYVFETVSYDLDAILPLVIGQPSDRPLESDDNVSALAFGVNWDWPDVRGSGFETVGHHQRAWLSVASEAWGSNRDFVQAYASSSWHRLFGERWKLMLRGEFGYTDADYSEVVLDVDGTLLQLSVTELPNLFRFKAGGSRSVRGYAFESLSDNGLGSNNIVTASAELEFKLLPKWSLATFFDAGNAFNDWDDYKLRKGVGVGLRWYSIAGALRFDVAQALDLEGEPWRVHFTIGTPLL